METWNCKEFCVFALLLNFTQSSCLFKKCYVFVCVCLQETLENVKKCKNFLSTLIKLASGGKQSSETTANVKELVKSLLVNVLFFPFFLHITSSLTAFVPLLDHTITTLQFESSPFSCHSPQSFP